MVVPSRPLNSASKLQSLLRADLGCFLEAGSGIISYLESKCPEVEIMVFLKPHNTGRWVGGNELRAPKFQPVIWSLVPCSQIVTRQNSSVAGVLGELLYESQNQQFLGSSIHPTTIPTGEMIRTGEGQENW